MARYILLTTLLPLSSPPVHCSSLILYQANAEGWTPSTNDPNAGVGKKGACCAEMDIWEANSVATALTPHSCQPEGYSVCTDTNCGGTYSLDRYAGSCDANGCDFNPYRVGVKDYYGKGMTVNGPSAECLRLPLTCFKNVLTSCSHSLGRHIQENDSSNPIHRLRVQLARNKAFLRARWQSNP